MLRALFFGIFLFCFQGIFAQSGAENNHAKINIGNNEEFAGFELLDTPFSQSRLLLIGQNSEFGSFNRKLEFKTLRYLHQKFGLRQHLLAVSPNQAWWINRYILDGDTLAEAMLGAEPESRYFKMYKGIKKLNDGLPAEKKIRITGIDYETSPEMPALRIAGALPDTLIPERLRIGVETVKAVAAYCKIKKNLRFEPGLVSADENRSSDYGYFSARKSMLSFLGIYDSLRPAFQNWLGNRFNTLDSAVATLREFKQYEYWQATALEDVWREDILFLRTTAAMKQFPTDRFLLVTGRCHAPYQIVNGPCNLWHFSSLARRLKQTADNQFKTLSLAIFYTGDNQIDSDLEDENPSLSSEIKQINNRYLYAKEARILKPSLLKSYPVCDTNFDMLILNNRYPLSLKEEEESIDEDDEEPVSRKNRKFYTKARLYLGYQAVLPKLNWEETNRGLNSAGMSGIENRRQNEFFVAIKPYNPNNSKPVVRFSYGQYSNAAVGYRSTRLQSSAAFNFMPPASPLRLLFGYTAAWQNHQITKSTNNNAGTFISQYEKPVIIRNPMTLLGGYLGLQYEIRYFFISGEIGYLRDLSNQRWRNNGDYIGTAAKLSGHQSYWNVGAGFCIPLFTMTSREGEL